MRPDPCLPLHEQLQWCIDQPEHTEVLCQGFLPHVKSLLVYEPLSTIEVVEREQTHRAGRPDVAVIFSIRESGRVRRKLAIWEVKAPQCHILKVDSNQRLVPTTELTQAESQLLSYHYHLSRDTGFLQDFGIADGADVLLGGIIIGCNQTLAKPKPGVSMTDERRLQNYHKFTGMRREKFYQPNGMRLYTWSDVVETLRPAEAPRDSIVAQ